MPSKKHDKNIKDLLDIRRELRANATPAEHALWNIIRGRKVDGLKFYRQYSLGQFVVDFYCPSLNLAIELDGNYHYMDGVFQKDQERDRQLLEEFQTTVLRFANEVVFNQPEAI